MPARPTPGPRDGRGRSRGRVLGAAAAAALACGSCSAWPCTVSASEGDATRGRQIAQAHCSRCHRLSQADKLGGIDSTPSFPLLVARRPDWRERFATFFERRPHPAWVRIDGVSRLPDDLPATAAPIELEAQAVADIVAYAETLKTDK